MAIKPSIPKGTRDFSPQVMRKRNYIFDTIKEVFVRYGFQQIETPAFENLSTLTGKYGDEGDRLIFKILNSGNYIDGIENLNEHTAQSLIPFISEKALRYDLTVPFARYVVQYQNDIVFPFKRFQVQPVWRADRPQKGRYREFFQCDVDIIGSNSLLNEAELVQIIDEIFLKLSVTVEIRINNRKILAALAEACNMPEQMMDITVAIDKLDKIGEEKVKQELLSKNIPEKDAEFILEFTRISGSNKEKLSKVTEMLGHTATGKVGIAEMEMLFDYAEKLGIQSAVIADFSLARGLNYYTGAIFEVIAQNVQMGSICGGGRYDDLTGIFGLPGVSGVGVSFGADRIYDVMENLNMFPKESLSSTQVLFVNLGIEEELFCLPVLKKLRANNIRTEIYPEQSKLKKQMNYADKNNIIFVVIIGENEINTNTYTVKNMKSGEQLSVQAGEIIDFLTQQLQ